MASSQRSIARASTICPSIGRRPSMPTGHISNETFQCYTFQANCQAQGGTGQCYTCNYEFCNSSAGIILLSTFIASAIYLFI
ncbi:unnamed protein product [Haemonchus placei]|uniref:Uncharacterized protein n=1 Tax=Haemonchus placei TaxID=6290 RepID=A0A0N4WCV5_HAEPC|nr:unnamed protein product [Haemonchus placei]